MAITGKMGAGELADEALIRWLGAPNEALPEFFADALKGHGSSVASFRDRVGPLYRASVDESHAKRLGQYFTPDAVCDLMLTWAVQSALEKVLDPGCGTGGFLMRAADLMIRQKAGNPSEVLSRLYGLDLDARAAGLCRWQLSAVARQCGVEMAPSVCTGDFLGDLPDGWSELDVIVGNPPYVRQELLQDRKAGWSQRLKSEYADYLADYPAQQALFGAATDLYLLFLLRATRLLKPGGRLAFVMSNSWMDTAIAGPMMTFLNHWFHLRVLLESGVETWFEDAAINPVILLAERKLEWEMENPDPVQLVQLKRPLAALTAGSWEGAETLMNALLSGQPNHSGMTVCSVSQHQLLHPKSPRGFFYLRADETVQVLRGRADLWRPVSDFGEVRYPLKTGINRFFYITRETAKAFGIEPEFLTPVLKSAREVIRFEVRGQAAVWFLFNCSLSPEELRVAGKTGALSYIHWGEQQVAPVRQKRQQSVPWPQVASVQGRPHWYQMKSMPPANLLCSRFFDRRFFFATVHPTDALLEDQTFYGVRLNTAEDPVFLAALLNSTVSYLWVELLGRTNLGEGVLQYSRQQMADHWLPDPALYSVTQRQQIVEVFQTLGGRSILPIEQETAMADRQKLDQLVMGPLGADPLQVAEYLCRLVERRCLRAGSRRKKGREEK